MHPTLPPHRRNWLFARGDLNAPRPKEVPPFPGEEKFWFLNLPRRISRLLFKPIFQLDEQNVQYLVLAHWARGHLALLILPPVTPVPPPLLIWAFRKYNSRAFLICIYVRY